MNLGDGVSGSFFKNDPLTSSPRLITGKLDADLMHENLCKCFSEFFDAYLKKAKEKPAIQSNDVITVTEYAPDK